MTTRTKIDVHPGTLSMEFGDDVVHLNIFEAMRHSLDEHFVFLVDVIDDAVDRVDICTNLLSDFSNFSYFDFGSFNYASDSVTGAGLDSSISLPPTTNHQPSLTFHHLATLFGAETTT